MPNFLKLICASVVAAGAMFASTQFSAAQGGDPRFVGPSGFCEDFAGCPNVNREFNNGRVYRNRDVRPIYRDRDVRPIYRDRDNWSRDNWDGRRHHRNNNRYYRSGPSIYLDLSIPSQRYYEPRYVQPRYVQPRYVQRRVIRLSEAHYDWCYDRYRSYRASDNTFNPGKKRPRQQCYSPYS